MITAEETPLLHRLRQGHIVVTTLDRAPTRVRVGTGVLAEYNDYCLKEYGRPVRVPTYFKDTEVVHDTSLGPEEFVFEFHDA